MLITTKTIFHMELYIDLDVLCIILYNGVEMNIEESIDQFVRFMELNHFPHSVVNRRKFTFQRFADTYGHLTRDMIQDFIEDNNFLRTQSLTLLRLDILSWLHYLQGEKVINEQLYIEIDRESEEME